MFSVTAHFLPSCVIYNSRGGICHSEAEKPHSSQGRKRKSHFLLPFQSLSPPTTTSDVPADGLLVSGCPILSSLRCQGAVGPSCKHLVKIIVVSGQGNGSRQRKPFKNKRFWNHCPQPIPLVWRSILQLVLGEKVLEKLVDRPGNGSGRHLVDDAGLYALKVAGQAIELVHHPERVGHARQPAADVGQAEGHVLLSVEEGLTDVQGGGGGRGKGPSQPSGDDVGPRVVAPVRVDLLLQELIGDEVDGLEGNVHGQLRGVTPVEGPQALGPPHCPDAAEGRPVW